MPQLVESRADPNDLRAFSNQGFWRETIYRYEPFASSAEGIPAPSGRSWNTSTHLVQNLTDPSHPAAAIPASLDEVFARIDECQRLGPNWDGEDALPTDRKVVSRTKSLLRQIAIQARMSGLRWQDPSIAPEPGGGLELTWENGNRWVMLMVQPGQSKVGSATQVDGEEPRYRGMSRGNAVRRVLWALRER